MLESTKYIYDKTDDLLKHGKRSYKKAIKKDNIQIWSDCCKWAKSEIEVLKTIEKTKAAQKRVAITEWIFEENSKDIASYFERKNTL